MPQIAFSRTFSRRAGRRYEAFKEIRMQSFEVVTFHGDPSSPHPPVSFFRTSSFSEDPGAQLCSSFEGFLAVGCGSNILQVFLASFFEWLSQWCVQRSLRHWAFETFKPRVVRPGRETRHGPTNPGSRRSQRKRRGSFPPVPTWGRRSTTRAMISYRSCVVST